MPYITSSVDGASLFYRDYHSSITTPPSATPSNAPTVSAPTLVFLHGWPMSSAMWEPLMLSLSQDHRIRCVAPDRRGFGKSDWNGARGNDEITYETFASDTARVLEEALEGKEKFLFVGASMGCGEALMAWMGEGNEWVRERCEGFIWIGPSLPFPLQTPSNPQAPSRALWDMIVAGLRADRPAFVKSSLPGIFGAQEGGPGVVLEPAVLQHYERIVDAADGLAMERCVQIITEKDFTKDIKGMTAGDVDGKMRFLILHGDSDQGMPYEASSRILKEILGHRADVKVYEKAAHGLYLTHREQVVRDILGFVKTLGQDMGSGEQ